MSQVEGINIVFGVVIIILLGFSIFISIIAITVSMIYVPQSYAKLNTTNGTVNNGSIIVNSTNDFCIAGKTCLSALNSLVWNTTSNVSCQHLCIKNNTIYNCGTC